jgi:Helix-turn-helix domain
MTEPLVARPFGDTREVSAYLSRPAATLRQWRHRGLGPRSFRLYGRTMYRWTDVDKWVAEQEAKTASGGTA